MLLQTVQKDYANELTRQKQQAVRRSDLQFPLFVPEPEPEPEPEPGPEIEPEPEPERNCDLLVPLCVFSRGSSRLSLFAAAPAVCLFCLSRFLSYRRSTT